MKLVEQHVIAKGDPRSPRIDVVVVIYQAQAQPSPEGVRKLDPRLFVALDLWRHRRMMHALHTASRRIIGLATNAGTA